MKLRIAICDDDSYEIQHFLSLVMEYQALHPTPILEVKTFSSADLLLIDLETQPKFDIYLLDILMPGTSGMTAAQSLRERGDTGTFIFLTSSPHHALDAFQVHALHYLIKPVKKQSLFSVLEEAVALCRGEPERRLSVPTADGTVQVRLDDLLYVECQRHILCFHMVGGQRFTSRSIRVPFVEAVAPLLEDTRFLHAHKSFIVNMAQVDKLLQDGFQMRGGDFIPIPRNKFSGVRDLYLQYLTQCSSM